MRCPLGVVPSLYLDEDARQTDAAVWSLYFFVSRHMNISIIVIQARFYCNQYYRCYLVFGLL